MPEEMMLQQPKPRSALSSLQRRWAITATLSVLFLLSGYILLQGNWQPTFARQWLLQASLGLLYLLWVLWRGLDHNYRVGESHLLPGLGIANITTLLRGILIASLLGFLFLPWPPGWLAWIPAGLYTLAVLADFLDGFLARITRRVTRLGEILDMSFDGLGVLAASLLAIQYNQVPAWYLLVALARYLFLAGIWVRRRRGLPVHELQPSVRRKAFAGVQMGFLFFILMPVFTAPGTYIAAAMFALPFLVGFGIDWLAVCGVRFAYRPSQARLKALSLDRLPLLLRLLAVMLILAELSQFQVLYSGWAGGQPAPGMPYSQTGFLLLIALQSLVLVTLALGVSGRVAAIVGLCLLGIQQLIASLTTAQIALWSRLYSDPLPGNRRPIPVETGRQADLLASRGATWGEPHMNTLNMLWKPRYFVWIVALPILWLALREIPLEDIRETLSALTVVQLLVLAGINAVVLLLFTSRWWMVLLALGYRLPFLSLLGYRLAGFGISYFTPGPQFGGEPLQVHLTRERHGIPAPAALAAVSMDKILELLANFSFILLGVWIVLRSRIAQVDFSLPFIVPAAVLFVLPAAYLTAIWSGWQPLTRLSRQIPARLAAHPSSQKAIRLLALAEEHMTSFCRHSPKTLLQIMLITVLTWLLVIFEYWLSLHFLGYDLQGYQIISLLTAARIAFMLPSPGGLGTLEASQVLMFEALGLNPALGISISLLIRGRDLLLGGLGLWMSTILVQRLPVNSLPSQAGD